MISSSAYNSQKSSQSASRDATRPPSPTAGSSVAPSIITDTSVTEVESSKAPITLDTQVSAGGSNFSQGQRQLIAMARALLRHSSIIVLDEATSSIDFATDAKIQKAIREEFGGSLLLTGTSCFSTTHFFIFTYLLTIALVAHRLKTVIDYDRLIVLDKGVIVEFDTPYNLIQKEDGIFKTMCLKSGMFAELEVAAAAKAKE